MFDFVRHRALFYLLSAAIIGPGLISLVLPGGLRPGIDFTGGTIMTLQFAQPLDEAALRNAFVRLQHPEATSRSWGACSPSSSKQPSSWLS